MIPPLAKISLSPLFFPPLCNNCHSLLNGAARYGLCSRCVELLELFDEDESLVTLESGHIAAAAGPYLGLLTSLIGQLKFHSFLPAAKTLAQLLAEQPCTQYLLKNGEVVIPVPVSGRRRLERGFNQCELLLAEVAKLLPVKVAYPVKRKHRTAQHTLGRAERLQNVVGAFYLTKPEVIAGRKVVVFDDVMTTQATVTEMSRLLMASGARDVSIVTVARTLQG